MADKRKQQVLGARDAHVSRALGQTATARDLYGVKECTIAPSKRDAKKHAKARARCRLKARQRLGRDRVQAQQAVTVLEQALDDLGLPTDLVAEIEGRLRSQQKLLGKIVGMMFPPLFGCRTNFELCRVRGWDKNLPSRLLGALPKRSWIKRLRRLWAWTCWSRRGQRASKSLSQRLHQCPICQLVMDRDQNAAMNILRHGLVSLGHAPKRPRL
jgi:hypothetical protein